MAKDEPVLGASATVIHTVAEKKAAIKNKSNEEVMREVCYSVNEIKNYIRAIALIIAIEFVIALIFGIIIAVQLSNIKIK
ncbi:hypothetical protein IKG13_03330 [Candidatus Saccharibacteria bacterium]|nr:hypothetical protein [Candidatus Saccharibacteria bacterium]